jgi:hypothetical protein
MDPFMNHVRLADESIKQLNGHVRLIRQGTQSAVAAANSAFRSHDRKSSARLAIAICDDVIALCDCSSQFAGTLLKRTTGADRDQVLDALGATAELSQIAEQAKRISKISLRSNDSTATHPAVRGALRDMARRSASDQVRTIVDHGRLVG